jgi:hypothetical protein
VPKNRLSSGSPALAVLSVFVTFSTLTTAACGTLQPDTGTQVRMSQTYGKLPLHFEANKGQIDEQVKFLARGKGHTIFLTPSETVLVFAQREHNARTALRMTFVGANPEPRLVGAEELPGKANYFVGNDPAKWRTNVPTYAKVHYENVYPSIDLIYYGNQRQLEYDFVVGPGADPKRIVLAFRGADKLEVDATGDLVLHTSGGVVRQRKPFIYQEVDGVRREIAGGYVLKDARRVGFEVATYDASRRLVIDPVLFYSTYLGGSSTDGGGGVAVDAAGNAYTTGITSSTNFPTTAGAFDTTGGGAGDAFVTKLNPTGSGLVYSTYFGGSNDDFGRGIAVDAMGNAYVTGSTASTDLPTTLGAFQTAFGGSRTDAFVMKLNPTGSGLVYSTYLGGSREEGGLALAVDALGTAYVTGETDSGNFPTTPGAFQTTLGIGRSAFVTKLDPAGSALVYSTYLGGSQIDSGRGIAVGATGNAYVTGFTSSSDFPTTPGAFQTTLGGGLAAFVTKVDPTGSALVYSTYLGSGGTDGNAIAVDTAGNAYITGSTASTDFPTTAGAFQTTGGGSFNDAFVTKLNATGSGLVYSTYLGGTEPDGGFGIAVDSAGNAYVGGTTQSTDFPTTSGAFQTTLGGGLDTFMTKLNPTGSGLVYSTYLGGSDDDRGSPIAVDTFGNATVTGLTLSTDFPTTPGAFQTILGGGEDAFVAKITEAEVAPGPFTARVTGGGTIDVAGGIGNFHVIVQRQTDGTLSGRLQYFNHVSGARVQSVTYTSLVIAGNTATFDGTCTLNGSPCTFRVEVTDNGEPGTTDTFTISYPPPAPTDGGTLRSGNILIAQ